MQQQGATTRTMEAAIKREVPGADARAALGEPAVKGGRVRKDIEALCAIENRVAGSLGEARAVKYVIDRLRASGIPPVTERFRFPATFSRTLVLHGALGLAASVLAYWLPFVGLLLAVLVTVSFWAEYTGRALILKRLLPKVESENVIGVIPPREAVKSRVVLTAHLDAAFTGLLFHPRFARLVAGNERFSIPLFLAPFLALAATITVALIRTFRGGGPVLDGIHIFMTLVVFIYLLIPLEWFLRGKPVQGAADDAAGVAVILAVAEWFSAAPLRHTEVTILFTGAEESHLGGMWAYIDKHLADFDRHNSYFIALDTIGAGRLCYGTQEGLLFPIPYGYRLRSLAQRVAGKDRRFAEMRPGPLKAHTDVHLTARRGYQSLALIGLGDDDIPPFYHWPDDTPENVDDRITDLARRFTLALLAEIDAGNV